MKKNIEEFIVFIMGFAIVCASYFTINIPLIKIFIGNDDGVAPSLNMIIWVAILTGAIQFIVPFVASIIIICRSKNKIFSKLYGSFWLPTLLFGLCLVADYLVNINFKGTEDDLRIYNLFTSLSKNFLSIYVIAMINLIRLKILQVKNEK